MEGLAELRTSLSNNPAQDPQSPAKLTRQQSVGSGSRSGLFDDVADEAERAAKAALIEKIERWLAEEVGIGGQSQRHFEPTALIRFAWSRQLEFASPDEIYHHFVSAQSEDVKRRAAVALGISGRQLQGMAADELEPFAGKVGWLMVEQPKPGLRHTLRFVKWWCMLWREEAAAADGLVASSYFVCFAGQQAAEPLLVMQLLDGRASVAPPPEARNGYAHCLQLAVAVSIDPADGEQQLVLATETAADAAEW